MSKEIVLPPEKAIKALEAAKRLNRISYQMKRERGASTQKVDELYQAISDRIQHLKNTISQQSR